MNTCKCNLSPKLDSKSHPYIGLVDRNVVSGLTSMLIQEHVLLEWNMLSLFLSLSLSLPPDDVPPYFKMEPVATQIHLERNRLVLTCMAEGSWPLEFKWLHNGTELTRFSLEYRWHFPSSHCCMSVSATMSTFGPVDILKMHFRTGNFICALVFLFVLFFL